MYEIIPEEAYEKLPEDPHEKFVALARIAQSSVGRLLDDDSSRDFVEEVRLQFIETMRSVAEALDIEGLPTHADTHNLGAYEEYKFFTIRLSGLVAKARLKSLLISRPHSVQLGRVSVVRTFGATRGVD